jgi:hypothetical protein
MIYHINKTNNILGIIKLILINHQYKINNYLKSVKILLKNK